MDENRGQNAFPEAGHEQSAYATFPHTTTHGPHDKSSYHGKPEDWARNRLKRDFGGKLKNG
ncbi:MAG TPA: hypothetical protein VFM11_11655 [Burkholderiales bacterium]|nr:hypothetical protein [Burkholderiales bacterium]